MVGYQPNFIKKNVYTLAGSNFSNALQKYLQNPQEREISIKRQNKSTNSLLGFLFSFSEGRFKAICEYFIKYLMQGFVVL